MRALTIAQTDNTPLIEFDLEKGIYLIKGESRPEDVSKFYAPVMKWVEDWGGQLYYRAEQFGKVEHHTVCFQFEYFNSSSAKYIMDLILKINEINKTSEQINIEIEWTYDELDEDIEDAGKEFEDLTSVKFKYNPI
ncbi:MAG: DUF1987 domain-containing protein [Flavobacteriales bacterium]|nr:DUF1987 domain-containing protein [Flavobacteriales bacterium]